MAGTLVTHGSDNLAIERGVVTLVFDYTSELGLTKSEEVVLRAMPAGCKYLGATIQCLQGDAGATSTTMSLKHGATAIFTGSSDNGGIASVIDGGTAASDGAFLCAQANTASATAGNLIGSFVQVGTTVTPTILRITVTVFRPNF